MELPVVVATIILLIGMLYLAGGALTENCIDIAGCKQCWKTTPVVVNSPLCPNSSACVAQPLAQQNNAIVDSVLCACEKTKANGYSDESTNKRIQDTLLAFTGYETTAQEICEQPGLFLIKTSYE